MPTYTIYLLKLFVLTLTCLIISACNGSDKSKDFFAQAEGIYIGSTETDSGKSDAVAVVSADGTFEAADANFGHVSYGVLNASSQNKASGTITNFAGPGFTWDATGDGVIVGTINITQSSTDNSITGSALYAKEPTASFTFKNQQQDYDNPSSNFEAGTYLATLQLVNIELNIDAKGLITTDKDGCQYSGQLKQAVTGKNLYNVTVSVTSCGSLNGEYNGKAFFIFSSNSATQFALITHSNEHGLGGLFDIQ